MRSCVKKRIEEKRGTFFVAVNTVLYILGEMPNKQKDRNKKVRYDKSFKVSKGNQKQRNSHKFQLTLITPL